MRGDSSARWPRFATRRRVTPLLLLALLLALVLIPASPLRVQAQTAPGRFNAGGPLYTDGASNVWAADTGSTEGGTYTDSGLAIAGTTDDTLYQSERYFTGAGGGYAFAAMAGTYSVTLKFAEIWGPTVIGGRKFNVTLEGAVVLTDFDIMAEVGQATAVDKTFAVNVSDGTLNIGFVNVQGAAKISAIEVAASGPTPTVTNTPTPPATATATPTFVPGAPVGPGRWNAGGPAYTSPSSGLVWAADPETEGDTFSNAVAIANTTDDTLYQSERYFPVAGTYEISVPNGPYTVTLKFAEIYGPMTVGGRVFDVTFENAATPQLNDYDIMAEVGQFTAVDKTFNVTVNDGQMTILFTTVTGAAKISAIEVAAAGPPPATSTPVSPGPSTFRMGIYEAWGSRGASVTELGNMINDTRAHNLDGVVFTNGDGPSGGNEIDANTVVMDTFDYWTVIAPWNITGTAGNGYWAINNPTSADAAGYAQQIVDKFADHPALKGYNLLDDAINPYARHITLLAQELNARDQNRFAVPAGLYGQDDVYRQMALANTMRAQLSWSYPFTQSQNYCNSEHPGFRESRANTLDQVIRQMGRYTPANVPRYSVLQEHGIGTYVPGGSTSGLRAPTVEEIRLQHWLALGERLDGYFWFLYDSTDEVGNIGFTNGQPGRYNQAAGGDRTALYTMAQDVAARTRQFQAEYMATQHAVRDQFTVDTIGGLAVQNQPYINTLYNSTTGVYYAVVVNRDCSTRTVTVRSAGGFTGGQLRNAETGGSAYNFGTGISLLGGQGMFLRLEAPTGAALPVPANPPSLLANSSFDTNAGGCPSNWGAANGCGWDTTTVAPNSGVASLRMSGGTLGANGTSVQGLTLQANTRYALAFWVKTDNVTNAGVSIRYAQTNPTIDLRGTFDYAGTQDWTRVEEHFYTSTTLVGGEMQILWNINAGGTAWLDDVRLCEGDTCFPQSSIVSPTATPGGPTPTPTRTFTPTRTPTPGGPSATPTFTPTRTLTPSTTPTRTPTPGAPTATPGGPPTGGVPFPTFPYGMDNPSLYDVPVETWWASHPFNPENTAGYIPVGGIAPYATVIDVSASPYSGNIQNAFNACPTSSGCTLWFPNGTYDLPSTGTILTGKNNIQLVGQSRDGAIIRNTNPSHSLHLRIECNPVIHDYSTFNANLNNAGAGAAHATAVACATTSRARNYYVKNLTLDGNNIAPTTLFPRGVDGIVVDNVRVRNHGNNPATDPFASPPIEQHPHPGGITATTITNNVWVRGSYFEGPNWFYTYFDGCHFCGLVENTADWNFKNVDCTNEGVCGGNANRAGGSLFLTNDDVTADLNGDGQLTGYEVRQANHIVMAHNRMTTVGPVTVVNNFASVVGTHVLIKKNDLRAPGRGVEALVYWQGKCDAVNGGSGGADMVGDDYVYQDLVVDGNRVSSALFHAWLDKAGGGGDGAGFDCNILNNSYTMFGFNVKNEWLGNSNGQLPDADGDGINFIWEPNGLVDPPRTTSNNCLGGTVWETNQPCPVPPTPTPFATPGAPAASPTATRTPTAVPTGTPSSLPRSTPAAVAQPLVTTAAPVAYTVNLGGTVANAATVTYSFVFEATDKLDAGECIEFTGGFSALPSGAQARPGFCPPGPGSISTATVTLRCSRVPTACTAYADGQDAGQIRVRRPDHAAASVRVQSLTVTVSP